MSMDCVRAGEDAAALIAGFRDHLAHGRRRSPHTVRAYVAAAERFCDFLAGHHGGSVTAPSLAALGVADLRAYLAARRGEGLASRSAAHELSAVRAFLAFAGGEDARAPKLRGPRVTPGVPRPIAPQEVLALAGLVADGASRPWVGARDWAILLLLYGAGLRISEALAIDGGAVPLGPTLTVTGKRGKQRVVPILPQVAAAVAAYADASPWPPTAGAPLFRGVRGGPLEPGSVRAAVRAARATLGLDEKVTPHALRHSFATHLLAGGADLRALQELLGHASLSSTQVYTGVDAAHLLDVYRHAHPRGGG